MNHDLVFAVNQSVRRRRRQRDALAYRRNVSSTVSGLACNCVRDAVSRGLNGYRLTRLSGYRMTVLEPRTLSGLGQETGTLALEPVSDRKAIENAVRIFQRATHSNLSGIGDTQQAQSAASMAATGAKVGSIVPGIGTVIGAVVGAVVGWLAGKSKPVRASTEQVNACRTYVQEYMGYAAQMPNAPIPMDLAMLKESNWCLEALYASDVNRKDPRWFDIIFQEAMIPAAKQIVRKIYETPIGGTVTLDAISAKDIKGRTLTFQGFSFVNKPFTDLKSFSETYFYPVVVKMCEEMTRNHGGRCPQYHSRPEWKRLMYDLLAWAARTELPNISEADLKAASVVAAETGSSAKDVVTAVESIIKRSTTRGETSLLLTGQTDTPVPIPSATPGAPPTPVTTLPEIPGMTSQTASDITSLIKTMISQGQENNAVIATALDALADKGIDPVTVKPAVENEVAAQAGSKVNPWVIGGLLAAGAFLFAMPTRKVRR